MPTETLQRFGLRTHPFVPEIGTNGQPIDPNLFEEALNPSRDSRLLNYYFDVYSWSDTGLVGELDPGTGLNNFPKPKNIGEPVMLIVSGTEDTGRSSLINLLLHEIRRHSPNMYEVETVHQSRDKVQNVLTIAMNFVARWKHDVDDYRKKDLMEQLGLYKGMPSVGTVAHYPDLFLQFRQAANACGVDPVVVVVRKADHHDVWSCIYHSLAPLAKYIIVDTPKSDHAKTCHDQIRKAGGNVALMDAKRLDLTTARRYLSLRLQSEREKPAPDDLWPFSDSALAALYEPGIQPQSGGVRWPIGSLRGMLNATFDKHVDQLAQRLKPVNGLTDDECRITREVAASASSVWQASTKRK